MASRKHRLRVAGELPPGILGDWAWQDILLSTPIAALRDVEDLQPVHTMPPLFVG